MAYDSQIFSAQVYGGVSRYYCETASRVAKNPGMQVLITAPMYINAYLEHVPKSLVSGFKVITTNHLRLLQRGLSLVIGDCMLRVAAPDIVHETYYFPYRMGPKRAKRVLTIYDMISEKYPTNSVHAVKAARYKAIAAKRADHVICISESTRRDVIEILELPHEKTSVIHLGFDLMDSVLPKPKKLALPTTEPFLLFVGHRGGYKNFVRLLESYAASPLLRSNYKLICFGGGPLNPNELKMIQELDINRDQIMQLSGNDQVLAGLYEHASALVYPSLYEGFGIPPLEAMAYDCPVVCSDTSSIPEVVGEAGEYFEPGDAESMRVAIEHVVDSAEYQKILITKGRERLKLFSWDRCARETLAIYKNLI